MEKHLSTDPYKGVRDFYPEDMAVQRYIFDTWAKTAESFGFHRYDASLLEPADIYRSKGAENEEMVNEQTYTFLDRGNREVTLRPEMTPTVARLIAGRRHQLKFPVKWYSIPNLFRYERPQRGRLREHWQLNCDIFGGDSEAADIELISLANQVLLDFGAPPDRFEIRINHRADMVDYYNSLGLSDLSVQTKLNRLLDKKNKLPETELKVLLGEVLAGYEKSEALLNELSTRLFASASSILDAESRCEKVCRELTKLGIEKVIIDRSLARGFDYYTGIIFEIFDTDKVNPRSIAGGGRYDNLTALFTNETISGIGFGMGDVIMRDFLETHNLLPDNLSLSPHLTIIPLDDTVVAEALKIAQSFRERNLNKAFRVYVDYNTSKLGKKVGQASANQSTYVLVIGSNELNANHFTIKKLATGETLTGPLDELIIKVITETK